MPGNEIPLKLPVIPVHVGSGCDRLKKMLVEREGGGERKRISWNCLRGGEPKLLKYDRVFV